MSILSLPVGQEVVLSPAQMAALKIPSGKVESQLPQFRGSVFFYREQSDRVSPENPYNDQVGSWKHMNLRYRVTRYLAEDHQPPGLFQKVTMRANGVLPLMITSEGVSYRSDLQGYRFHMGCFLPGWYEITTIAMPKIA